VAVEHGQTDEVAGEDAGGVGDGVPDLVEDVAV